MVTQLFCDVKRKRYLKLLHLPGLPAKLKQQQLIADPGNCNIIHQQADDPFLVFEISGDGPELGIETLLQGGMMVCSECGYSLYRTSSTTSAGNKIYYYRCFGSDQYRFEGGRKCLCKPLRQEYIDKVVWDQIVLLLQNPDLIQKEVEKRVADTKRVSPVIHQKSALEKQKEKAVQAVDKLLDAYQEDLIPLAQLRKRMPELQRKVNAIEKDLENLKVHETALDQRLQLLDLPSFKSQIDKNLNQMDITEKKKILRLLVKEIIAGDDIIDIKHSIPLKEMKNENNEKSYQLCTRSDKCGTG